MQETLRAEASNVEANLVNMNQGVDELNRKIAEMKENISKTIQIDKNLIGIKATTNEKLGPEGREEGISCHSVVLLEKK